MNRKQLQLDKVKCCMSAITVMPKRPADANRTSIAPAFDGRMRESE